MYNRHITSIRKSTNTKLKHLAIFETLGLPSQTLHTRAKSRQTL